MTDTRSSTPAEPDPEPPPTPPRWKPERLTPAEIEELRRIGREQSEYARKAFEHLRPKDTPPK